MHVRDAALVALLLGFAACDGNAPVAPDSQSAVAGEWSFTLHVPGQPSSDSGAVTQSGVLLKEKDGQVTGLAGSLLVMGQKTGDELRLALVQNGDVFPVPQTYLTLKLVGRDSVEGSGQTPQPHDSLTGDAALEGSPPNAASATFSVTGTRTTAMSEAAVETAMNNASGGMLQGLPSTCDVISGAVSFAIGTLTDNAIRPMGGCAFKKDGGGYYIFGRHAPGSMLPVWTQNLYMPLEWVAGICPTRTYKFTFSYDGQSTLTNISDLLSHSKSSAGSYLPGVSSFLVPGQSITSLAAALDAFKSKYGNFALLLATHPRTRWVGLYVITEDGSQKAVNETVIKTLAGNLHASVVTGKSIKDTYSLRRSIVPCGDYVVFAYLIGTANVDLD